MAYKVVYDTNLRLIERSGQFTGEAIASACVLLLFMLVFIVLLLRIRKRLLKLENDFSLVKSSIKKLTFELAKLSSRISSFQVPTNAHLQKSSSSPLKLTETDLEKIVSLMISKSPVKINKEKLKEMIVKNDLKALARALKISTSEVEILLNLWRKGR
jgi:hypothetical protein